MGIPAISSIHTPPEPANENTHQQSTVVHRGAICVCTCKRPKMLLSCLESLAAQLVPYDLRPFIIVVDNELEPNNEAAVLEFEKTSPYELAYWHEPRRGIAIARNTALRLALEFGAGWIVNRPGIAGGSNS